MDELTLLLGLGNEELFQHAVGTRRDLDGCHWRMGLALLAVEQRGVHTSRGCSGVIQFAVRYLGLDRQKASELLRVTRALLELPILARAFQDGDLGWAKIREVTRVATPMNDEEWCQFALAHDADEVQRRVCVSPHAFKKSLAQPVQAAQIQLLTLMEPEGSPQIIPVSTAPQGGPQTQPVTPSSNNGAGQGGRAPEGQLIKMVV